MAEGPSDKLFRWLASEKHAPTVGAPIINQSVNRRQTLFRCPTRLSPMDSSTEPWLHKIRRMGQINMTEHESRGGTPDGCYL